MTAQLLYPIQHLTLTGSWDLTYWKTHSFRICMNCTPWEVHMSQRNYNPKFNKSTRLVSKTQCIHDHHALLRDKNQWGNHKIMQSKNMTSSRSNICQDYVPRYAAPHWTKSTILTSWRGTLLCTSEEVENQRFIQGKLKSPNLTLKSLIYSTGNFGMGRNRQVTCMICNKSMRSDNLNRHMQSHTADYHS